MFSKIPGYFYPPKVSQERIEEEAKRMGDDLFKPKADPELDALVEQSRKSAQQWQEAEQAAQNGNVPAHDPIDQSSLKRFRIVVKKAKAATEQPTASSASTLVSTASVAANTSPSGFFAIVPFVLWLLHNSEEKHLHNYSISIKAPTARKVFRIAIGNENEERSLSFEIKSGCKVRFLHEKGEETRAYDEVDPLFKNGNSITAASRHLGPLHLQQLIWKRQTHITIIKVNVIDYNLHDDPQIYTIPLSENEVLQIVQENPYALSDLMEENGEEGDPLEFTSMDSLNVDVPEMPLDSPEKGIQRIPLSLQGHKNNPYLEIEQEYPL